MRALHEIEAATDGALRSLAERSAELAVDLAGKIVRHNLTPADHARLIERGGRASSRPRPARIECPRIESGAASSVSAFHESSGLYELPMSDPATHPQDAQAQGNGQAVGRRPPGQPSRSWPSSMPRPCWRRPRRRATRPRSPTRRPRSPPGWPASQSSRRCWPPSCWETTKSRGSSTGCSRPLRHDAGRFSADRCRGTIGLDCCGPILPVRPHSFTMQQGKVRVSRHHGRAARRGPAGEHLGQALRPLVGGEPMLEVTVDPELDRRRRAARRRHRLRRLGRQPIASHSSTDDRQECP